MTIDQWSAALTPVAILAVLILQRMNALNVRGDIRDSSAKSDDKLNEIHGLVNGKMIEQKRVAMVQAQRIADLTKDDSDQIMAVEARRIYLDGIARQRRVDSALSHLSIADRISEIEKALSGLKCQVSDSPPEAEESKQPTK